MVSAIITTYKREPYLVLRAIDSILKQTYRDFEIIIVDDSPIDYQLRNDVKKAIIKQRELHHDISIKYIQHDRNLGACAARNTGLSTAKGDYVAYLDDDDEWLPDKLEKQMKVMMQSDAALVYCGCFCRNDTTGMMHVRKTEYRRGRVFGHLLYRNFIASTSFPLLKANVLRNIGGFDEEMQSAQDYDVWIRIARNHNIDYVAEPLVIYHMHAGEQITSNPWKKLKGLERLNEKYKDFLEENPKLFNIRYLGIAPYYAMVGDTNKAIRTWKRAVRKYPSNVVDNIRSLRAIMKAIKRRLDG